MTEQDTTRAAPDASGAGTARSKGTSTALALRAAYRLAQRYETGQHQAIALAMQTHPGSEEYRVTLDRVTVDLLSLARRDLSVRLAANDALMRQDVSVLLARTAIAALPFGHIITGAGRPRDPAREVLAAVLTVAYVHEDASTPAGARKLREEIDYIWGELFTEGGQPA